MLNFIKLSSSLPITRLVFFIVVITGVLIVGLDSVLFVSVAVELTDTRSASPPVLGRVSVLEALSECGAACKACA